MHTLQELDWQKIALFVAVTQVLHILLVWLVSSILTRETATFPNALKYYFSNIALVIVLWIAVIAGVICVHQLHYSIIVFGLWVIVWAMGIIIGYFAILMKIYDLGCMGALVFSIVMSVSFGGVGYMARSFFGIKPTTAQSTYLQKIIKDMQQQQKALSSPSPTPAVPAQASTPEPAPSAAPTPRPVPKEIALIEPVQISVTINGQPSGEATLPRGMHLKLIAVDNDKLTVQYMETVTSIPRKSTDFPVDAH